MGANLENLTLTGKASVDGTGNALDNVLTGNGGANTLTGGDGNDTLDGGKGADDMAGGEGDDSYVVDNAGDVIQELTGQGTDTVESSINFTLGANVENLTLTGKAASGTGNDLDNILTGTTRNNTLTGKDGDDTYVVLNSKDVVVELAGEGNDTVESTVTFELGDNIENLTLIGARSIDGAGNELDNMLTGNIGSNDLFGEGGNDILNGKGGADSLFGGVGDDTFVYEEISAFSTIEDFEQGSDLIDLSALDFDDFADFQSEATIVAFGDDAFINYVDPDGAFELTVIVAGVDANSLTQDDFLF